MERRPVALLIVLLASGVFGVGVRKRRGTDAGAVELIADIIALKAGDLADVVQTSRRILQRARQWQSSHPAEWRLGKCVARYCIDANVPGIAQHSDDDYDDIDYDTLLIEPAERSPKFVEIQPRTIDDLADVKQNHLELKVKLVKTLNAAYSHVMEYLARHQLLGCTVHYALSKFWMWVDSAP